MKSWQKQHSCIVTKSIQKTQKTNRKNIPLHEINVYSELATEKKLVFAVFFLYSEKMI
jgi:hypothetical protein